MSNGRRLFTLAVLVAALGSWACARTEKATAATGPTDAELENLVRRS